MTKCRLLSMTAICTAVALFSSAALSQQKWTEEENTSGVKKLEYVRYAFAGQKMKVQALAVIDLDCSVVPGWGFEMVKQPDHGTVEIKSTAIFPAFPKESPRYKCNEHKIDIQYLWYTPKAGYKGPDTVTWLEIGPDGYAFEKTYHFNVRPLPTVTTGPKQRGA